MTLVSSVGASPQRTAPAGALGVRDTPSDRHPDYDITYTLSWLMPDKSRSLPLLITNPAGDVEFAALAKTLLRDAGWSPDALAGALYHRYPSVAVHRRELASEPFEVWYVYRDGRWIP